MPMSRTESLLLEEHYYVLLFTGVKAHEAFELSGSESEEEGEYTDNRVVYDSSDDSEADSDFDILEKQGTTFISFSNVNCCSH